MFDDYSPEKKKKIPEIKEPIKNLSKLRNRYRKALRKSKSAKFFAWDTSD